MAGHTRRIIPLSRGYSCNSYNVTYILDGVRVNFIARARTATAIKDERIHGRARILEDQWRHVQTHDSELEKRWPTYVICMCAGVYFCTCRCAQNRRARQACGWHTWKCCNDCIYDYCGNAAAPVYSCSTKYFMQVGEKIFGGSHARETSYRLKLSGYQELALRLWKTVAHLGCGCVYTRGGWFIISTIQCIRRVCISIVFNLSVSCDPLFPPVTISLACWILSDMQFLFYLLIYYPRFHPRRKGINNQLKHNFSYNKIRNVNFSYIICICIRKRGNSL